MRRTKTRVINFRVAIKLLDALTTHLNHSLALHPEKKASISDWLQNPNSIPKFGDATLKEAWTTHIFSNAIDEPVPLQSIQVATKEGAVAIGFNDIPFPPTNAENFSFVDLFAGIGGFRLAMQRVGGKCVFSSEWDKGAKETYFNNFGEVPFGDINQFSGEHLSDEEINELIPDHDILAGGFPCQPFSHAGVSARTSLGKQHGFACETQGTLFFNIVKIAQVKRPRIIFLENVKNLVRHDKGKTFETIKNTIVNDLGYSFMYAVVNSSSLVPQKRERCFMVAFRDHEEFEFPSFAGEPIPLHTILEENPAEKYTISDKLWAGHINRTKRNQDRGMGFTAFEADLDKPANTLVARYGKDGKECLIPQRGKNPRKLTPRECARLQGFPENFILPKTDSPAYRQFGNSVAVPVVETLAAILAGLLERENN
jgi:DNA (cytosine-5)-methyltransferase 1